MDTGALQSDRKRQCESGNGPSQCKVQRLLAISPSSTKITDLNDNCLENIFHRLDMRSLFNVAVANEYLRPAAGIVYKRKLDLKMVVFKNEDVIRNNRISNPYVVGRQVNVHNIKLVLQYLRCLGSTIDNLTIFYHGWNAKQCDHIHQYLNQYCAKTLASIRFMNKPAGKPIEHIEKPFVNVRTVVVDNSGLGAQLSSFPEWFPNLRSLTLEYVYVDPRCAIDMPFQHLVEVNFALCNRERDFAKKFSTRLLQLCPQLDSLFISIINDKEINLEAMLKIIEGCRSICNSKVNMAMQRAPVTLSDVQQLVDAHPSLAQLQLYGYEFSIDAVNSLLRQLNSLKEFQFKIPYRFMYDQYVFQLNSKWRPTLTPGSFEDFVVKLEG